MIVIEGYAVPVSTLNVLSQIIPACATLTQISFWNCGLTEAHFNIILQIVNVSPIRVLLMDQNHNIPESCFPQLLQDEVGLKTISLRGNRITDNGCKLLASNLKNNRTLFYLNLFDNKIGKEGANSLAEVKFNIKFRL
jgi:Ran GTPase-activating protein (RanGAP) involved in mRNA processing and transport